MKQSTILKLGIEHENQTTLVELFGPNNSTVNIVVINGVNLIIQEWEGNNGFDVYCRVKGNTVNDVRKIVDLPLLPE